jgi:hypothetical protein
VSASQKPDATHVAGLYTWNQLGRRVKKAEKGIRILAPIIGVKRKAQEEAENDPTRQNVPVLIGFRTAYVFERLSRDLRPGFYAPMSPAMHLRTPAMAAISSLNLAALGNDYWQWRYAATGSRSAPPSRPLFSSTVPQSLY